ncbi:hypothetical protein [Streptacidiphilus jiangxiensis]|uniref:Uncharacterized protein n=1 Tax=Streptacidiphilus jiangxiensis TaxID=235985 RepID=A0A1H7NQV6_STRJI|nr:hypothetical protein [Streptacidiphilus jiangxiensis]SEL25913.1 hypothetical protein SAMN05414137_10735 [Streptacidiphilus jiangxiensis]
MSNDANRDQPIRNLSTWTLDRLEAFTITQQGHELERIRVVAQSQAYRSDEPRHVRLRWAKLSLNANARLPGDTPWSLARKTRQNFALRTWIIDHLGPDTDSDWDPEVLAADTLEALALEPDQATTLSASRRDLPTEQISELRRHKNKTAHLDRLLGFLPPGPDKVRLTAWAEARKHLP